MGNLGTIDPNFHVTDIRLWIRGSSTLSFSDEFNSIGLMVGTGSSTTSNPQGTLGELGGPPGPGTVLTNVSSTPTVTTVHYPNGQSPASVLWQLDFPVSFTGASGQQFSYAIVPDAKPCSNASGNGESYYIAFLDCVMTAAQTGHNPSGDGYVADFIRSDGSWADSFSFPYVWGGVRPGDVSMQVIGTHTGTTYTWNTGTSGSYNWTDTTQWSPSTGFPDAIDDVATFQYRNAMNVDLGGASRTVGTLNLASNMWNYCAHISNGTLIFQGSGGTAQFNDSTAFGLDDIRTAVTLNSDLTLNTPVNAWQGISGYSQYYPMSGALTLKISGAIGGAGGITKTGPGMAQLVNPANNFAGNIAIQEGYLVASNYYIDSAWHANGILALGNSTKTITMGGDGTVGHLVVSDNTNIMANPIVLTGAGGALHADWFNFQLNDVISGTGNLFIGRGTWVQFDNTADNTYVGDTKISGLAKVNTGVTARVFNGNIAVQGYGQLTLDNANNVDSTKTVMVGSFNMPTASTSIPAILAVNNDFVLIVNAIQPVREKRPRGLVQPWTFIAFK